MTDVILSGKGTKAITKQDQGTNACCSYGISGMNGIQGYDCLHIPGAMSKNSAVIKGVCQAGGVGGVVTASGTTGSTVCCKLLSIYLIFGYPV